MNCQSCAMPLNTPSDHALGNEQSPYCVNCADASGNLKSKEEVREGMINYYTQTEGKTREEAERVVDAHMAMQPAWQQNTQPLPQTPVEPAEPVVAPQPSVEPVNPEPVVSEPVVPEPVAPVMPSTPVIDQSESLPTPEPIVENTNEPKPVEPIEGVDNPETITDNSGNSQV